MEFRLRFHDGSHRWVLEQCRPLLDADQKPIGFIGSCLDLTELKQAEADAQQRGAMLESMFDVLQDMLFVIDLEGRILSYHGASDDNLYVPPEVFLGRTMHDVLPPDVADAHPTGTGSGGHRTSCASSNTRWSCPTGCVSSAHAWPACPTATTACWWPETSPNTKACDTSGSGCNSSWPCRPVWRPASSTCPWPSSDHSIGQALGEIGAFVQADRAYIFAYDLQARTASNTHEWCGEGIEPAIDQLQDLPMDLIPQLGRSP